MGILDWIYDQISTWDPEAIAGLFALIGVVFGVFIQKSIADRSNYLEYITRERQKWRCELRSYIKELYKEPCDYLSLRARFEVRLNPTDDYDKKILQLFDDLIDEPIESKKREISREVAHLLKHDWERVKAEAGSRIKPYHGALGLGFFFIAFWCWKRFVSPECVGLWQ